MAGKRGNGEGSIYKRGDGVWAGAATVSHSETGKARRRVVYGATRGEVAKLLAELQGEAATGTLVDPAQMTVGSFLVRWLEDTVKPSRRLTTFYTYRTFIRKHLKPRIGGFRLQRLQPIHVQSLFATMEREGVGARTRQAAFATLRRALADAVRLKLLGTNPAAAVDRPRAPRPDIKPLNFDQVEKLLETAREMDAQRDVWRAQRKRAAAHRLSVEALVTLALGTGARQGELFGLKWSDYDVKAGTLSISRSIVDHNGTPNVGEGKTRSSRRTIDLPAFAAAALAAHRQKQPATPHPSAWIFADWNGAPLRRQNFASRTWRPLVKRAGMVGVRFHDLRHSAASFLLTAGVHPRVAQQILGHSDIATTMSVYSHVSAGLGKAAAAELDALLGRRRAPDSL